MTDLTHTQLGQYQLTELIRRGGMSMVYKAYQPNLDRFVAVKVLMSMEDPQFASRFKREARAIAQLQHPNILPIYDHGEQNGLLYLVLQYIEQGITLGDMLTKPMDVITALQLICRVLDALDYAHHRSIVHRDIKPGNILMPSPSWPMLADFGIAKVLNESQQFTLVGTIIGTAAYIAPEQAIGRQVDARTDVYSVGVVLFEMLTGEIPFDGDTPMEVSMKHAYQQPPSPRQYNPEIPAAVESAVLRALAKDPQQRYQSAAEMAADLGRITARLEQARARNEIIGLYKSGLEAFAAGNWDQAVERLTHLVALDPAYEDATELLEAAREQQLRVGPQAQPQSGRQRSRYTTVKHTLVPAALSSLATQPLAPLTESRAGLTPATDNALLPNDGAAPTHIIDSAEREPNLMVGHAVGSADALPQGVMQGDSAAATAARRRYLPVGLILMLLLAIAVVLVLVLSGFFR